MFRKNYTGLAKTLQTHVKLNPYFIKIAIFHYNALMKATELWLY